MTQDKKLFTFRCYDKFIKVDFKDQCDGCKEFKSLKGYNNKCLCNECIKNLKLKELNNTKLYQLRLF